MPKTENEIEVKVNGKKFTVDLSGAVKLHVKSEHGHNGPAWIERKGKKDLERLFGGEWVPFSAIEDIARWKHLLFETH